MPYMPYMHTVMHGHLFILYIPHPSPSIRAANMMVLGVLEAQKGYFYPPFNYSVQLMCCCKMKKFRVDMELYKHVKEKSPPKCVCKGSHQQMYSCLNINSLNAK